MCKKQIGLVSLIISAVLGVGAFAGIQNGQKIGIDLGPTTTNNWNNITGNGVVGDGSVVALDGSVLTGISITTAEGRFFNNDGPDNWAGLLANEGSAPAEFVDSVTTDIAGTYGAGMPPFVITVAGLNNSLSYDVVAVCTSVPPYANEETLTINDTMSISLTRDDARDNGTFHSFAAVATDGAGNLVLVFTNEPQNNPIVCGILITAVGRGQAGAPRPQVEAEDVLRSTTLSWVPGPYAATHDVYFGMAYDDVNDADANSDLLISQGRDANSFDPGRLEFGETYFWRVDEVNGTPDKTVFKGDVWRFTTEPYSIEIPGSTIVATASSQSNEFSTPDRTIDGSGLANGIHGIGPDTMWFTTSVDLDPWIQYEFDSVKKLDTMTVWNSNSSAEVAIGWGVKDVQIEVSLDGETWDAMPEVTQLSRAPGLPTYAQYDEIALGGVAAKLVRLNIQSNWGGILMAYSLGEVQFNMIPARAREPMPAVGAVDITPSSLITWRAGREAAQHTVYVSTDQTALTDGSAPSVSSSTNSLDLSTLALELGKTYYWRVDEVNEAEATSVWAGPVWSFSTPAALTVDEFESYSNDSPNRPFQTWLDGFGYSADEHFPVAYAGNGTGSGVGHDIWSLSSPQFDGQIMEQSIVKSGGQSLPFYYNNTGGVASEIDRTWSTPQDWSVSGVQSLVLNFYGDRDNTGTSLYVKINGETVTYPDNAALSDGLWIQWVIDLSSLNTDLQNVTQLTLGVEGIGAGTVYIDAIRLYPNAAEYVLPVEPDVSHLVGYYALDGNARDDSGQGNHGVENGAPIYDAGVMGQAIHLNGIDDFVGLGVPTQWPSGAAPRTLCAWAQTFSVEPGWRIIAGYGSPSGSQACALVMNGTALYASGYGNDLSLGNFWDTDEWHHVGLTYDGTTVRMYADGMEVASEDKNWNTVISVARIGRQVNEANEFWDGRIDEVRVYNQVLSLAEMAWLGGKTAPVVKPF